MDKLDAFIKNLAERNPSPTVDNMYFGSSKEAQIRKQNLRLYLKAMENSQTLLIGEAPGHLGCAKTGIPFTSEDVVLRGIEKHNLFGTARGYQLAANSNSITAETTATIVWGAMKSLKRLPLMWNAFPWHPHEEGNVDSNRTPTIEELRKGAKLTLDLVELFKNIDTNIKIVIAVGRRAEKALDDFILPFISRVDFHEIRHPAHGGKKEFVEGVTKLLA